MSLITRCPNCQTLFKVVPDQLRISEGWVRCGQCDEIFDGSLHLLQSPPAQETAPVQPQVPPAGTDWIDAAAVPAEITPDPEGELSSIKSPQTEQQAPSETLTTWRAADSDLLWALDEETSVPTKFLDEYDTVDEPAEGSLTRASPATLLGPVALTEHDESEESKADGPADLTEVSFLQVNDRGNFWRKPVMRVTLALLSLALLLGLLGQVVLHERDRIVALEPGLRPWLLALCKPLTCRLSPLMRIESIVIDSSSFTRMQGDAYRLTFTVKNTADIALAVPAIELTLTDSLDQPVVRRVLLPSELGVTSDTLTAGAEWPISVAIAIQAAGMSDRVAGYRLLTFYP